MRNDILDQAQAIRASMDLAGTQLTDEQAAAAVDLYPPWQTGVAYVAGDMRRDGGLLYRCIQPHTSQADWRPADVPALWVRVSTEAWPEWAQPAGAHDAYAKDAQVSHNGQHWISGVDNNTWEPGVYGWGVADEQ